MFLDVFGNTVIEEKTLSYTQSQAKNLVNWLSDECEHRLGSLIDLSLLTGKQRDSLFDVLDSWSSGKVFDIAELRDERLRSFYGCRYDHRENHLDWLYHSSVKHVRALC